MNGTLVRLISSQTHVFVFKHLLLADVRVGDQLLNEVIQAHLPFFNEGCNEEKKKK